MVGQQTYQRYKQVVFFKNKVPESTNPKVIYYKSSGQNIRNIEIAVTKLCNVKGYAFLMYSSERFSSPLMLEEVAKVMKLRGSAGGFLNLEKDGEITNSMTNLRTFRRRTEAMVNPNLEKLKSILNHLRVFSIDGFRYIPQTDLRDIYGNYFKDRLIFLMTMLENVRI